MRLALLAFIAVSFLGALGMMALSIAAPPTDKAYDLRSQRAAWREACKLSGYSCWNLRRPSIAEAPLYDLLGRYRMGDQYIVVREGLTRDQAYVVMVHEMVHYLQFKHGKWTYTRLGNCLSEKEAFSVSTRAAARLGVKEMEVDWTVMRVSYGCPP